MTRSRQSVHRGDEMTTTSYGSAESLLSLCSPHPTHTSISNSDSQDTFTDLSYSAHKLLNFDHSKVHGRQKELSILEEAARSMVKESNGRNELSTQQETYNENYEHIPQERCRQLNSDKACNNIVPKRKQKQLVLISGYSGTGKSVLAHSIRDLVINKMGGTFVTGKFDQWMKASTRGDSLRGDGVNAGDHRQRQQQRPYTAFRTICDGLVQEAVAMKMDTQDATSRRLFEKLKDQLMMELGTELVDLIQVFPSLDGLLATGPHQILGESSNQIDTFTSTPLPLLGRQQKHLLGNVNTEARFRFKYTFGVLFRIMASVLSPLVLVIDDLQWADTASLDLLESLLSNRHIGNLMVIGSYRSNEVDETHMLPKTLRDIRTSSSPHPEDEKNNNKSNYLSIVEMEIGNLNEDAVHDMISSLLLLPVGDKDRVKPLAKVCYKKTGGNPFYLTRFIRRLYEMRMLSYDDDMMDWTWDERRIELYTDATDNVVDLLKQSMTSLSPDHQTLLKFGSFLGSRFEERPLFVLWTAFLVDSSVKDNVWKSEKRQTRTAKKGSKTKRKRSRTHRRGGSVVTPNDIDEEGKVDDIAHFKEVMKSCQDAGYVEQSGGEQTYRWVHDKLQEAAMDLVHQKERRDFSQYVAEVLRNRLTDNELEPLIFVLVERFNEGNLPAKRSKRTELAKLNLRAAEKAVSYSAFESAASYCKCGIRLLPMDCWDRDYDLSLKLYSLGAETEGFLGHVHVMEEYCKEVLRQKEVVVGDVGKSRGRLSKVILKLGDGRRGGVRDKFRAYNVMMLSIANRNLPEQALQLCLDVLGEYGVRFPRTTVGITCRIGVGIMKLKLRLRSLTREEIENLPMMEDPVRIEQMGVLGKMSTYCYMTRSDLYPLVASRLLNLTLEYGYCKFAPISFGINALILCGVLGDLEGGRTCADYALILLNKLDSALAREVESKTVVYVYGFAWHWGNPLRSIIQPTLRGYEVGMQGGTTESAIFNVSICFFTSFVCGINLDTIERDYRIFSAQMKKLKQGIMFIQSCITWQVVLNLMNRSQFTTRLTGEALKEDVCREEVKTNPMLLDSLESHKMILCSFFGDYKSAADYAYNKGDSLQRNIPGTPLIPLYTFHRCLSLLAMARIFQEERSDNATFAGSCNGTGQGLESRYVRSAKKALNKIKNWVEQGNPQSRHYEPLLEAELAAYHGDSEKALEKYEMAVDMAADDEFIQDVALANERYGMYLLSQCDEAPGGVLNHVEESIMDEEGKMKATTPCSKNERRRSQGLLRLEESIRRYREWGGHGKANILEEKYGGLFRTQSSNPTLNGVDEKKKNTSMRAK